MLDNKNEALKAEEKYKTALEAANDYIENFDLLETITNVGNDEVFTPRKTCDMILDSLPEEVWHNPDYKWLNPATKNGIFEREIALRLDEGLKDIIPNMEKRRKHILQNMIYSIGQTRFTANVARRTVYYCSQANRKCDGLKANDGHYLNGYSIGNGTWFDDVEGNIKTPNVLEHDFDANGKCKFCPVRIDSRYNDDSQLEKYAYEFIHVKEDNLLEHLQNRFFGGNRNMKFDIIVGNPPYQLSVGNTGGNSSKAPAIYHKFVSQAIALKPKYICMIMPSRWMTKSASGIDDDWVEDMLNSNKISEMHDYLNANDCFPNNEIKGGVCYFLINNNYQGKCNYNLYENAKLILNRFDYLNSSKTGIVIRDKMALSILEKIKGLESEDYLKNEKLNFSSFVGTKDFFTTKLKLFSTWSDFSDNKTDEFSIKYYTKQSSKGYGWISFDVIPKNKNYVNCEKVFIPAAGGSGNDSKVLGNPFYGEVNSVCSQTYLIIGHQQNLSKKECFNIINYIKTKFFRYLISVKKKTPNGPRMVYEFVPLQNFKDDSDINWSKSINNIDEQLFKKYKLNKDEIEFIDSNIQEMK